MEPGRPARVFRVGSSRENVDIYSQAADGAAGPRLEFAAPGFQTPQGFTPTGRVLAYELFKDIGVLTLGQARSSRAAIAQRRRQTSAENIPGRTLGGLRIQRVGQSSSRSFSVRSQMWATAGKISVDGGRFPRWDRKGSEIYTSISMGR